MLYQSGWERLGCTYNTKVSVAQNSKHFPTSLSEGAASPARLATVVLTRVEDRADCGTGGTQGREETEVNGWAGSAVVPCRGQQAELTSSHRAFRRSWLLKVFFTLGNVKSQQASHGVRASVP